MTVSFVLTDFCVFQVKMSEPGENTVQEMAGELEEPGNIPLERAMGDLITRTLAGVRNDGNTVFVTSVMVPSG